MIILTIIITWIVYLQTPNVFQSLIVLSRDPDTICLLSAENATLNTSLVWPTNRRVVLPKKSKIHIINNNIHELLHSTIQSKG